MEREEIRILRRGLGLSQERFAQLLSVSLQTVRRWEEGLSRPLPIIDLKLEELRQKTGGAMTKKGSRPEIGVEIGLGGLFKGLGSLFDLVSKMAEEGQEEYSRTGEVKAPGGVKGVYGFSIKVGLGGKPVIEPFGNLQATEAGVEVAEVREPLVDVLDEGDYIRVIAELPGMEEKDIRVEIKGDILELTAPGKERKYHKELLLPCPVEPQPQESTYRNGILELKLAKRK